MGDVLFFNLCDDSSLASSILFKDLYGIIKFFKPLKISGDFFNDSSYEVLAYWSDGPLDSPYNLLDLLGNFPKSSIFDGLLSLLFIS